MNVENRELTERDFARAIPRKQRERILRGRLAGGDDVVALRRFVGLTQQQFADALGISVHTLRNYESDLLQFFEYLAPVEKDPTAKAAAEHSSVPRQDEPNLKQIDHLTIREWLATLRRCRGCQSARRHLIRPRRY